MADNVLETIVARLKANTAEMSRGFESMATKAKQVTDQIGQSFEALGKRVQNIGSWMTTRITAPFSALVGFSIKAASDVQEMQNLIAVTFGEATSDVESWAESTSRAVNRSRFDLLKAAGDFAAFLKPLGVAPDRIVPMSKALSQLVTDISSFRNMTEEEVAVRLFSGMAGEAEAVRRLGVDLSQAAIEAELLRLGFKGNAAEASQAQKSIARYNLIVRQTADAQGDAARTASSYENRTRELGAVFRDIRIEIGNMFLPTATKVVTKMSEIGRMFMGLSDEGKKTALTFGLIAAGTGPLLFALGALVRIIGFSVSGLGTLLNAGVKTFTTLGRLAFSAVAPILTIPGAIVAGLGALYLFRDTVRATFTSVIEYAEALGVPITEPIRQAFEYIKDIGANVQEFFAGVINKVVDQFNNLLASVEWLTGKSLKAWVMTPVEVAREAIDEFVSDLPEFNLKRIGDAASSDLDRIKTMFRDAMQSLSDMMPEFNLNLGEVMQVEETGDEVEDLQAKFAALFASFDDLGQNANDNLQQARFTAQGLNDDLREAFVGRLSDVKDLGDAMTAVFDRLKAQLLEIAFFGTEGTGGLFGPTFAKLSAGVAGIFGARATGGPVQKGQSYLVGERGPEMFTPETSGRVTNAADTRSMNQSRNVTVYQSFSFPPDNAELTQRMVGIAAVMRDQAISAFKQANNQGF